MVEAAGYVMFFDGGCRDPGPGGMGIGAVILRLGVTASECEMMHIEGQYLPSSQTASDVAKVSGLRLGLQVARAYQWHPLLVVGDSNAILDNMSGRAPLRHACPIQAHYQAAVEDARGLVITDWIHHPRAYNKMAHKAVHLAMDCQRDILWQDASDDDECARVLQWVENDVGYLLNN